MLEKNDFKQGMKILTNSGLANMPTISKITMDLWYQAMKWLNAGQWQAVVMYAIINRNFFPQIKDLQDIAFEMSGFKKDVREEIKKGHDECDEKVYEILRRYTTFYDIDRMNNYEFSQIVKEIKIAYEKEFEKAKMNLISLEYNDLKRIGE